MVIKPAAKVMGVFRGHHVKMCFCVPPTFNGRFRIHNEKEESQL
jgi:hypothetical protein